MIHCTKCCAEKTARIENNDLKKHTPNKKWKCTDARTDEATNERQIYTKKWSNIYTYSYFYKNHCRAEVFSQKTYVITLFTIHFRFGFTALAISWGGFFCCKRNHTDSLASYFHMFVISRLSCFLARFFSLFVSVFVCAHCSFSCL